MWYSFKPMFSKCVQKKKKRVRSYMKGRAENKDMSGSTQRSSFSNKFSSGSKHMFLPQHKESADFEIIPSCLKVTLSPSVEPLACLLGRKVCLLLLCAACQRTPSLHRGVSLRRVLEISLHLADFLVVFLLWLVLVNIPKNILVHLKDGVVHSSV